MLTMEPEGHGIARWLNQHGITGVVLQYRLPNGNSNVPLLDAQQAIRLVRSKAADWGCDPKRIGIMGFSAGDAYRVADNGFITRRGWPWTDKDGCFQGLDHNAQTNLAVIQRHPQLGQVTATCSYAPDFFPIWGNPFTFSWEPYLERTVAPGQTLDWRIDYDF